MISVLFSTYNGEATLPRMLKALSEVAHPPEGLEIIAVDNASTDRTFEILRGHQNFLPMEILQHNVRGKNHALNMAVQLAKGRFIVFTDDDVLPEPFWLTQLIDFADRHPYADIIGGRIEPCWESEKPAWVDSIPHGVAFAVSPTHLSSGEIHPGLIWGPNMMVRRTLFDQGHRFDGAVGPGPGQYCMGSETEFNIRMHSRGSKTLFCQDAIVYHIIRKHQIRRSWVLKRAFRFGKGIAKQDRISSSNHKAVTNFSLPFPKWYLRRILKNTIRGINSTLPLHSAPAMKYWWDVAYDIGYITQALRSVRAQ
ncbi:glycosyltransferase [Ectothiorhodospira haloalkaliphila]|uniref:glycosyltransferase n=1 Tax=Ectothiorhodospira haloalkaliphila TaxID=421628 RepID=UPI001EE943FF|nr:glycosyltransferase family 2 protein [Ectothiorhodospira haloalkaliphila]MCG5524335.1 glycosyltransferase [Ectothiorhodospira haloalkaliphila]